MFKILMVVIGMMELIIADVGCKVLIEKENQSCQESTLLTQKKESPFGVDSHEGSHQKSINITEKLVSVDTQHLEHKMSIERMSTPLAPTCPPFCIEPMKIKGVETVGELELLAFIQNVEQKRDGLLIDVRKNLKYKEETIPSAVNLPYEMLMKTSPYQKEVLKSLGAKKLQKGWFFKNPQKLLIFGESSFSPEASKAIKALVKLGYPTNKLLYYRGGIVSWKATGLTLI